MKSAIVLLVCVATVAHAAGFGPSANAFAGFGNQRPQYRRPPQVFPKPLVPAPIPPAPVPVPLPVSSVRYAGNDRYANILKYNNEINPDGSYNYYYETDNGIAAQEQGTPRNFGGNPPVVPDVAQGSFSWTSPEGRLVAITYVADENGYQPQGDAIPTPPPVPAQIARALDYIARNAKQ